LLYRGDVVQPIDIGLDVACEFRGRLDPLDEFTDSLLHEVGHIDLERVIAHPYRTPELKDFIDELEVQSLKSCCVAFEEARRRAANDAVKRRDALLAIE